MAATAIFELAYNGYPAYNTTYIYRSVWSIAVDCGVRSLQLHERRKEGEHMKRICSCLMVLFLAVSPAWAVVGGGDITFKVEGAASVTYSHDSHVGAAKLKCAACHPLLYKNRAQHVVVGMANMQKGKSCGACHDGKKAFSVVEPQNCEKCHVSGAPKY